ncbi:MAG: hypothetical protein NC115_09655 [Bacteroidales bacterium]|nr:hypothetical protein [Bacteroidales bacterium]
MKKTAIKYFQLCSILLLAGCNVADIETGAPMAEEGTRLTASAEAVSEPATKGYWHYMDGGSAPFHWTGKENLVTSIFSKDKGDWQILTGNSRVLEVNVAKDANDSRIADIKGTIISNTEIAAGDFICFTNGEVNPENPSDVTFTLPDSFIQKGPEVDGLSDYMFIYGQAAVVSADASDVAAGKVTFRHVPSTFRFDIVNNSGKNLKISTIKMTITDAEGNRKDIFPKSAEMTIDPSGDEPFSFAEKESEGRYGEITLNMAGAEGAGYITVTNGSSLYASTLVLPAAFDGETMTVSALYHGSEEFTELKTVTLKSLQMQAGHIYVMDIDIQRPSADPANIIDLSANGTANTYVVNKPLALYSFNASVKGNGIQRDFYGTELEENLSIEPKSALLFWYNCLQEDRFWKDACPVVIESIEIVDGKIRFETPEDFVEGNAVIAAFAEEGVTYDSIEADENGLITNATMLWSWNIWAVAGYVPEDCGISVGNYVMMDRNLGALRNELVLDGVTEAFVAPFTIGNYYQWGRKDPFPHHADTRNYYPFYLNKLATTPTYTPVKALQHTITDNDGTTLEKQMFSNEGITNTGSNATKIAYKITKGEEDYVTCVTRAINNPHKFITDCETFPNWLPNQSADTHTFELWGDSTNGDDDDAVKTIYDPCPAGWRLWTKTTLMEMKKISGEDNTYKVSDYGVCFCGSYFAFNGRGRTANGTNLFNLDWIRKPQADMPFIGWTATSDCMNYYGMQQKYYNWQLKNDNVTFDLPDETTQTPNSASSIGRTVRCVKE